MSSWGIYKESSSIFQLKLVTTYRISSFRTLLGSYVNLRYFQGGNHNVNWLRVEFDAGATTVTTATTAITTAAATAATVATGWWWAAAVWLAAGSPRQADYHTGGQEEYRVGCHALRRGRESVWAPARRRCLLWDRQKWKWLLLQAVDDDEKNNNTQHKIQWPESIVKSICSFFSFLRWDFYVRRPRPPHESGRPAGPVYRTLHLQYQVQLMVLYCTVRYCNGIIIIINKATSIIISGVLCVRSPHRLWRRCNRRSLNPPKDHGRTTERRREIHTCIVQYSMYSMYLYREYSVWIFHGWLVRKSWHAQRLANFRTAFDIWQFSRLWILKTNEPTSDDTFSSC